MKFNLTKLISHVTTRLGKSFEELRVEDYAKGNKGGAAAGGFAMTSFMQQPQTMTGGQSSFGAVKPAVTNTFGGTSSLVSGWGSTPTAAPAFGAPSTFGTQMAPKTGTGLFGQQTGTAATNIFAKPTTTAPFNMSPPAPATTGGFSFGAAPAPAPAPQAFGAPAAAPSLFGAPAPAATTSFLGAFAPAPATGTVGFGTAAAPAPASGAFSLGAAPATTASGGGIFGGAATSTSGFSSGGGLFGKTAAAPAPAAATGCFSFGSTAPAPATGGFGFGSTTAAAKPQTSAFSFPPALAAGGSLLSTAPAPAAGVGLFGAPAPAPIAGGGLWGGGTGGLFSSARAPSTVPSMSLTGATPATTFGGAPLFATPPAQQQQQPQQALLAGHNQSAYGRTEPGSHGAGELLQKVQAVTRSSTALELELGPGGGGRIPPTTEGSHEFHQMNVLEGSGRLASSMGRVQGAVRIAPRGFGGDDSSCGSIPTSQMNGNDGSLLSSSRELVESNRLLSLSNSETTFSGVIDPRAFAGRSAKRLIINTPVPKASDALPGLLDAPPLVPNSTPKPDLPALPAVNPTPAPVAPNTASSAAFETPSKTKELKEQDFPQRGMKLSLRSAVDRDGAVPPSRPLSPEQRSIESSNVPLLRRPGYGCRPSLKDMESMTNSDLSRVPNFSIWHTGFGSITFLKPVDLRGVDLDAIVSIERRDIAVYDTKEAAQNNGTVDSAPIGHGLNQPAIIAMHSVFPGSKSKKDAKTYLDGLKKNAEAMGAIHDNYDAVEGVWTFRVPHFSRYALVIDDDDSNGGVDSSHVEPMQPQWNNRDGPRESKKQPEECQRVLPSRQHQPAAALGLSIKWLDDAYPSSGGFSKAVPVRMEFSDVPPIPSPLSRSISTAVAAASSTAVEMDTSTPPIQGSSPSIGYRKPCLKNSDEQNARWRRGTAIDGGGQSRVQLIYDSPSTPDAHLLGNSPCLRIFNNVMAVDKNRGEQQFWIRSSRVASDLGLRMGWSVPVSWGPSGEIVWCGGSNSATRNGKMKSGGGGGLRFSVHVHRLSLGRIRGEGVKTSLMVNKRHAVASTTSRPEDAAMKWSMSGSYTTMVNCIHDYMASSSALDVDDSSSSSLETRECWHLVSALWGQEERGDQKEQQQHQLDLLPVPPYPHPPAYDADGCSPWDRRWLAIRKWVADAVHRKGRVQGSSARHSSASSAEAKFLERLLAVSADESAHLAASTLSTIPSPRLATLIALAMGGDLFVREQLRMQLCQWDEAGASDLIPPTVRQTLELLSGSGTSSTCGPVGAALGSEWLEQLAECLFYIGGPDGGAMSLAQALAVFDDVMSCPPLTEYALLEERKSYTATTTSSPSISINSGQEEKYQKFSLIYHLLCLYATEGSAGLTQCLDPACLTRDPLDYSSSWHLMLVLDGLKLPYPHPPVSVKATITASIASQLCLSSQNTQDEGGGGALWPWAAFILLYESNGWEYAAGIDAAREIVMRFGYAATRDEWTMAVDYLGLPEIWLRNASELFLQYQTGKVENKTNMSMSSKSSALGNYSA